MKEKINVAELLKDCPKGMELDCAMFDYVTRDDCQLDMFEPEDGYSCMSLYHGLCE